MQAFTIPVAFLVEGDTEQDAVNSLADILSDRDLVNHPLIESWWTPNHPSIENGGAGDIEQVLLFVPGVEDVADVDEVLRLYRESPAMAIVMNALPSQYVFSLRDVKPIVERVQRSPEAMLLLSRLGDWLHDAGLIDKEG